MRCCQLRLSALEFGLFPARQAIGHVVSIAKVLSSLSSKFFDKKVGGIVIAKNDLK